MKKLYVILEGGTGEMTGKSLMMVRDSTALLRHGNDDVLRIYYPTIDGGGTALGSMKRFSAEDGTGSLYDSGTRFAVVELSEGVREQMKRQNKKEVFRLKEVAPKWFLNHTLFPEKVLVFDLTDGFGRNQSLGALVQKLALDVALESKGDREMGFQAIVRDVIHSDGKDQIYVVLVGSAQGGEGIINLSRHPAFLREMCLREVQEKKNLPPQDIERYVDSVLKIAVIMVGAAFCFPQIEGLDQDIHGLVAGALENYPPESEQALSAFYLLEHDHMPVQATRASYGNDQYKHSHAIELVGCAAIEDFVDMSDQDLADLRTGAGRGVLHPLVPHYSLPGNSMTTWKTLNLPEEYRRALSARLRFDCMLCFWLYPQLMPGKGDDRVDRIFESEILHKMYGVSKPADLRNSVTMEELENRVLRPFYSLMVREKIFLNWLLDISKTGFDWEKGEFPEKSARADLFPPDMINLLFRRNNEKFLELGGMTGFDLDRLTVCGEGNLYSTRYTPDHIRKHLTYRKNGSPLPFMEIVGQLYDLCADTEGRRKKWHL